MTASSLPLHSMQSIPRGKEGQDDRQVRARLARQATSLSNSDYLSGSFSEWPLHIEIG